ncbi:MAG: carbamate kinase [Myxococcota bacterium]|nr:carbamate kinase [Myxococcota bacterium]
MKADNGQAVAVVAFGGNAILRAGERGLIDEQVRNADRAVMPVVDLVERGYGLLMVHGNGPQVGIEMIRVEEASTKVPPIPLDVCDANTQGAMGYVIEKSLRNALEQRRLEVAITSIVTMVQVDPADPAFQKPTKPIGPYFNIYRAQRLMDHYGWAMVEEPGRGWRKVVASPRPVELIGVQGIRVLLAAGHAVIAGGGGGIPVVRTPGGSLAGIEAVIDKDFTAALLAREVEAHLFIVLTAVDEIFIDFGTPAQRAVKSLTCDEAERHLREGQFPPGSMGPKVEAAVEFLRAGGREVIITSERRLPDALRGLGGSRIVQAGLAEDWGGQQVLYW